MTTAFDPRRLDETANAFFAASFSPVFFETMAGNMMRVAEAEFALLQAIMQAQLGMMEAMMQAGKSFSPVRHTRHAAPAPADGRGTARASV